MKDIWVMQQTDRWLWYSELLNMLRGRGGGGFTTCSAEKLRILESPLSTLKISKCHSDFLNINRKFLFVVDRLLLKSNSDAFFPCACHHYQQSVRPGLILKRNGWFVVSAEKVKIEYFFKKIFNSYIYVLVDNDTIKNSKENLVCKFPCYRLHK